MANELTHTVESVVGALEDSEAYRADMVKRLAPDRELQSAYKKMADAAIEVVNIGKRRLEK